MQSVYTPSQIQDWYREDKIQAGKDRQYSSRVWIPRTRNTKIRTSLTWPNHVLHGTSRKRGKDTKTRCIGSISNLLKRKDWSSIKQDVMQSSFTTHSQLIVSRKLLWWNLETSYTRKYMCHLASSNDFLQRSLDERIGFRSSWSSKDTQRIQPKPKTQLSRTGRPVGEQQFIQLDEMDIDFRVPGLSHAVVKEAENVSVQELVKKIESHPHRSTLQADLQQNKIDNPFSNNSKAMIRELGNVELFELCETTPKVQCSHCLLCWNQGIVYCTCGQFLVESEPKRKFNKLGWMLSRSGTNHERVLSWCSTR